MNISFADLGLDPNVLKAVADQGYETPTPIQSKAIPVVLAGRDVLGAAQTGTGKTAAFTLPILTKLAPMASNSVSPARHPVRALFLTPTRELADQVSASVTTYSKHLPLRSTVVFGGVNMDEQSKILRNGVEIVVATPGRLLDHVQQKSISLGQVEILVLDEADRMLDMGFIPDIRRILDLLTSRKQTLMFSATFSPEIKKLAAEFLNNPETIEVAQQNATSEMVKQELHPVENHRKQKLLAHLIRTHGMTQVIAFCRTKQGADQLARDLKRERFSVEAIHGDRLQSARMETLAAFKDGKVQVLVATDVAARGIDVANVAHVVNFDLPKVAEDFVHRVGRTGRASAHGVASTFAGPAERGDLMRIERTLSIRMKHFKVRSMSKQAA